MSFLTIDSSGGTKCRAIVDQSGDLRVQAKRMSKSYITVDPRPIAIALTDAGYKVREFHELMETDRGWTRALEAESHEFHVGNGDKYRGIFKALFDHSGNRSVRVHAGAMRCTCANDFYGDPVWIARHDDADKINEMINDPVKLFDGLCKQQIRVIDRIESLHNVRIDPLWKDFMKARAPRIGKWTDQALRHDYREHPDMWGFIQALTHIKRQGGQKLANEILSDRSWDRTKHGLLPESLTLELAMANAELAFN
jgi:hypothetical protein